MNCKSHIYYVSWITILFSIISHFLASLSNATFIPWGWKANSTPHIKNNPCEALCFLSNIVPLFLCVCISLDYIHNNHKNSRRQIIIKKIYSLQKCKTNKGAVIMLPRHGFQEERAGGGSGEGGWAALHEWASTSSFPLRSRRLPFRASRGGRNAGN